MMIGLKWLNQYCVHSQVEMLMTKSHVIVAGFRCFFHHFAPIFNVRVRSKQPKAYFQSSFAHLVFIEFCHCFMSVCWAQSWILRLP